MCFLFVFDASKLNMKAYFLEKGTIWSFMVIAE